MIDASTPDGRGQDRPNDAEPFFPSEGSFNPVVPLSEVGRAPAPAPLVRTKAADLGKPAEAAWAREAHRAGWKEEEETTLVPARSGGVRGGRRSWVFTAAVITLSVAAGLASGTYLIWSAQRAPQAQTSAQVSTEAPSLPPAPVAEQSEAVANVEQVNEPAKDERLREGAKAEQSDAVAHAPKHEPPLHTNDAPRAERATRAEAEAREVTAAPKPARSQSAAPARPRVVTAERRPPAAPPSSARSLPISSPPPSAKSKKVIQWP